MATLSMMREPAPSRWPVVLLCLISTVLLGVSGGFLTVPLILVSLLLSHLLLGVPPAPRPRTFYAVLLAVPFALWWRYGIEDKAVRNHVQVTLLIVFGLYMMSIATQQLLAGRRGGSSDYALACAVMGLGIAGAASSNVLFFPLLVVFVATLLIHLRRRVITHHPAEKGSRPAWGRYGAALIVLLALTAGLQVLLVERLPELNRWMMRRLVDRTGRTRAGFDRTSGLSSVSDVWDQGANKQVALRVFADQADAYLRGAVYDRYEGGRWRIVKEARPLEPTGTRLGRHLFNARPDQETQEDGADGMAAVVYPSPAFADAFFIPLGVHRIASYGDRVWASEAQTIRPAGLPARGGYGYFASRVAPKPPTPRDRSIPAPLRRPLRRIARRVMSPRAPPGENFRRLKQYFVDHFSYRIGLELRTDKDPVVEFLEDIRAGHCEYFASSATLLLRSMGVPARYVTGFLCKERGLGDLWLARRKDAHAWVEAYVPGAGGEGGGRWVTFDPTPPSARPSETPVSAGRRLGWWLEAQWRRLTSLVFEGGLTSMIGAGVDWLLALPSRVPLWAWSFLTAAGLAWVFRRKLRALATGRGDEPEPPRVRRLRAQLIRAEKLLGRHGLRRPPAMTAGDYLRRVRRRTDLPAPTREEAEALLEQYQRERFRG